LFFFPLQAPSCSHWHMQSLMSGLTWLLQLFSLSLCDMERASITWASSWSPLSLIFFHCFAFIEATLHLYIDTVIDNFLVRFSQMHDLRKILVRDRVSCL
jgi:hypothetical protein